MKNKVRKLFIGVGMWMCCVCLATICISLFHVTKSQAEPMQGVIDTIQTTSSLDAIVNVRIQNGNSVSEKEIATTANETNLETEKTGIPVLYLYNIDNPNQNYTGHAVNLSASQYLKVLRSIFGEQEDGTFEIYVGLCQYIRDYIDYGSLPRTYDNLGEYWLIRGGTMPAYMDLSWFQTHHPELVQAADYVFAQGGSLAKGMMHFYFDDDDTALQGSYEVAYNWLATVACSPYHYHDRIHLGTPKSEGRNWVEFCLD